MLLMRSNTTYHTSHVLPQVPVKLNFLGCLGGGSARRDRPRKRAADEAAGGLINKAWAAHPCRVFPIPTPSNHNTADID